MEKHSQNSRFHGCFSEQSVPNSSSIDVEEFGGDKFRGNHNVRSVPNSSSSDDEVFGGDRFSGCHNEQLGPNSSSSDDEEFGDNKCGGRHSEQLVPNSSALDGEEFGEDIEVIGGESPFFRKQDLELEIRARVEVLDYTFSSSDQDRLAAIQAIDFLSKLSMDDNIMGMILDSGAVPVLVKHLQAPPLTVEGASGPRLHQHEVEAGSAFILSFLTKKREHQQRIVDAGALPHLVDLLKRYKHGINSQQVRSVIRNAAAAINSLAYENSSIRTQVRIDGGIPPLVELLEFADMEVQRTAAETLCFLCVENEENKNQIVECNALPSLILMLCSESPSIQFEAVCTIGNLVDSSPNITNEVIAAGALQPVIGLLSSCLSKIQNEAALILGQFAETDSDCKVHIIQRGAVPPLIEMLQSPHDESRETSAYALAWLAQDTHNQVGIAQSGGIVPLLKLLESEQESLQHNVASTLYALAHNEDNAAEFIRVGGVEKLLDVELVYPPSRFSVEGTLERLKEKIHGRVLSHLLYMMRVGERNAQRRVALALAHLCSPKYRRTIFIDNNGLTLLLELLESSDKKHQRDSSRALCLLTCNFVYFRVDVGGPSIISEVDLDDEHYVNNPTLSDVTFLVEGKRFYAHRVCLLAASIAFRVMLDGGDAETEAEDIQIPDIKWDVFELMMRYIYTGCVDASSDIVQDLLRAADQYQLKGLRGECENIISLDISVENVLAKLELSVALNAMYVRHACILFLLQKYEELYTMPWYSKIIRQLSPEIYEYFVLVLEETMCYPE